MNTVTDFFKEKERGFTIYVVEQLFVTMRGNEYFKSFRGKDNLIDSDYRMEKHLAKILKWIQKNVPNIAELIKNCYNPSSLSDIIIPISIKELFFNFIFFNISYYTYTQSNI